MPSCHVLWLQVEPAGHADRHPVRGGHRAGGDEDKRHPHQPHHHPRHEGPPYRQRWVHVPRNKVTRARFGH